MAKKVKKKAAVKKTVVAKKPAAKGFWARLFGN